MTTGRDEPVCRTRNLRRGVLAALSVLVIAACGHGGGDAGSSGASSSNGSGGSDGSSGSGGSDAGADAPPVDAGPALPTACDPTNANCPLIYRTPPELGTGQDAANVVGQRLGSDITVWAQPVDSHGVLGTPEKLEILSTNEALVQVRAPQSISAVSLLALWAERVVNDVTYDSAIVFVNSPTISLTNETTVRPGGSMTIWGRLLSQSDVSVAQTSVVFHAPSGDVPATIASGDSMQLQVNVPASLVPGTAYSLVVSNGLGGSLGATTYSRPITAGTAGGDPLKLGVYWGAELDFITPATTYDVTSSSALTLHAKGDGKTDDTAALQAALDFVGKGGGGAVYAPAGTYIVSSELLVSYPKTVLMGAGPSTVFSYGATTTATTAAGFIAFAQNNVTLSGISSMTVTDLISGANGIANGAIRGLDSKTGIAKVFMADVTYHLGQSFGINFGSVASDIVITRCTIDEQRNSNNPPGTSGNSPINVGAHRVTLTDNIVSYRMGRVALSRGDYKIVTGNTFTLDGSVANLTTLANGAIETGGIEFSFNTDVVIAKNTLAVVPAPDFATLPDSVSTFLRGCMEHLMSQTSIYGMSDYGVVSGVNGVTLSDSTKNWAAADLTVPTGATGRTPFVAITDGPGIGQIRNLVSHTATTMTVDTPFDVPPTPGSSAYTVSYFVNQNVILQDNNLNGGQIGAVPAAGSSNVSVHRNTIYGTHGIRVVGGDLIKCACPTTVTDCPGAGDLPNCTDGVRYSRTLMWHADVVGNVLDGEDSPANGNYPEAVWAGTVQFEVGGSLNQGVHGNTAFDIEVRRNSTAAHVPAVPPDSNEAMDGWYVTGTWGGNWKDATDASPYPGPLVSTLGVIFQGNQAKNAVDPTTHKPVAQPLKMTANGLAGLVETESFTGVLVGDASTD